MNKDKTIPKLWDDKVDKGGYTGTAQNLKSEIDGKVSKSGDTISGNLKIKKPSDISSIDIYSKNESYGTINKDDNGIKLLSNSGASSLVAYDNGDLTLSNNINRSNIKLEGKNISISTEGIIDLKSKINSSSYEFAYTLNNEDNEVGRYAAFGSLKSSPQNTCYGSYWSNNLENTEYYIFKPRRKQDIYPSCVLVNGHFASGFSIYAQTDISKQMNIKTKENCEQVFIANQTGVEAYSKNLTTNNKEIVSAINELNSGKVSKNGGILEGGLEIKNATYPIALNYITSAGTLGGGFARGYKIQIDSKDKADFGIFGGDGVPKKIYIGKDYANTMIDLNYDGTTQIKASNLKTNAKEVISAINELKASTYKNFVITSTSTTNPAEYIGNTTWTRIGEQNVGGTTVYYWKRNS